MSSFMQILLLSELSGHKSDAHLETLSFVKIKVIWDGLPWAWLAPLKQGHPSLKLHGVKILLLTAV